MKLVIFGTTLRSSFAGSHAPLWQRLCHALVRLGARVVFFERDVPHVARRRDLEVPRGVEHVLYEDFRAARQHLAHLIDADAALVSSFCPDAIAACRVVLSAHRPRKIFYDLETPLTVAALEQGEPVPYVPEEGLGEFDVVLSRTGGIGARRLGELTRARRVVPFYDASPWDFDPPRADRRRFSWELSCFCDYAVDLHETLQRFFVAPAALVRPRPCLISGAFYPANETWPINVEARRHMAEGQRFDHLRASRLTLHVSRPLIARCGYCPSARLFLAAAVGVPVVTTAWEGLWHFFEPGREILVAHTSHDVLLALERSDGELEQIAAAARERATNEHSAYARARELVSLIATSRDRRQGDQMASTVAIRPAR